MSNIHSRRTPFGQQSRRYRKSVYIETKNQIRRHAPILGGLFTTHHYMHDKLSWIDGYFLAHKAPIFYNFALETTRNAYKELICDQGGQFGAGGNNLGGIPQHRHVVEMSSLRKRRRDRTRFVAIGQRTVIEERGTFSPASPDHVVEHVERLGPVGCPG